MTHNKSTSLFESKQVKEALAQSFVKLNPKMMIKNPVMFTVEIGTAIMFAVCISILMGATDQGSFIYNLIVFLILLATLLFANFAEAIAEARGKAQADSLRKTREETPAKKVLVIGAGGLGAAILPYLASAGVGEIGIIDDDFIEVSNLHRQVIYKNSAVGKSKVEEAKLMISELNPLIKVNAFAEKLSGKNAISLFEKYDSIVDATDNISIKYLINDACVLTNKPMVYGSIFRFQGQVSVFNYQNGPTYRCLYPDENSNVLNCEDAGVIGVSVGIIGMLQANEVIKMILGIGEVLSGKILVYNILSISR